VRLLSRPLPALLLLAVFATGLSACGSGGGADLLPGTTANQITSNLDQVQRFVGEEECSAATEAAAQVTAEVDELGGVDAQLKQLLVEGAERLEDVLLTCEEGEEEPPPESSEEEEEPVEDEKASKHEKPEKNKPPKEEGPPVEPPEPPGHEEEKGNDEEAPPEETGGIGPNQQAGGD
jgi:outer membrane biosynthesis protein TonB